MTLSHTQLMMGELGKYVCEGYNKWSEPEYNTYLIEFEGFKILLFLAKLNIISWGFKFSLK